MADQSSVGSHLAELYNSIHQHQQEIEAAKEVVKEKEAALEKVKGQFLSYLREQGIDKLLAPAQADLFGATASAPKKAAEGKERKPRTSSADKQAEIDRNKAIYTSTYPNGIDDKTGLPKRFKGRGQGNVDIDAQMKDDERDYEARNSGAEADDDDAQRAKLPESLATKEAAAEPTTAAKPASKGKTKADAQPA